MNSGSDVLKRQFVTMRTIWPDCIDPSYFGDLDKTRYGLDQTWARAEQLVSNSVEFGKYLGKVSAKTSVSQLREGKKQLVCLFQTSAKIPGGYTYPRHADRSDLSCSSSVFQEAVCRQNRSQRPVHYGCRGHLSWTHSWIFRRSGPQTETPSTFG